MLVLGVDLLDQFFAVGPRAENIFVQRAKLGDTVLEFGWFLGGFFGIFLGIDIAYPIAFSISDFFTHKLFKIRLG